MPKLKRAMRSGFTLIELLVVILLLMIIAGMGVAFLPAIGEAARQAQAASVLQQWILTAKQRALRDRVPFGIRLLNKDGGNAVVQCQYIEQPDDYALPPIPINPTAVTPGLLYSPPDNRLRIPALIPNIPFVDTAYANNWIAIDGIDLTRRWPLNIQIDVKDYLVATNDYFEILGGGLMHRVAPTPSNSKLKNLEYDQSHPTGVIYDSINQRTLVFLSAPLPFGVNPTFNYRFVRAPRETGDEILQLPDGIIIDIKTNQDYGNPLPGANPDRTNTYAESFDFLFSPTGSVISSGSTTDSINLWVREFDPVRPTFADPANGDQTIIAIYVRSGLTAAHPPAPGGDPYFFIRDGKTSGK